VHRRHALHITVVMSKAAHSGPSVCLRARAPCPLRVSCPGADRALSCAASLQARACRSSCRFLRFRAPLGARQKCKNLSGVLSAEALAAGGLHLLQRNYAQLHIRSLDYFPIAHAAMSASHKHVTITGAGSLGARLPSAACLPELV
jgi:hypothetical protein